MNEIVAGKSRQDAAAAVEAVVACVRMDFEESVTLIVPEAEGMLSLSGEDGKIKVTFQHDRGSAARAAVIMDVLRNL